LRAQLGELYKYRELLYMIVIRDIKVRYKQSVMGFLWAILMPVLIVSAGVLVRYAYGIASHKPLAMSDVVSVATKSIPWAFLVSSIKFSCQSLLANHNLVTKVYFPKEIFPIAAVLALEPEAIIMPNYADNASTVRALDGDAIWRKVPAVRAGRVYEVPGAWIATVSHHAAHGLERVARVLHPEAF